MNVLLALLGFAPTETQAKVPPALGWFGLIAACYASAWIVEFVAQLAPVLSVYFRTIGLFAIALLGHGMYRAVVHRDGLSWSGWLRERLK